MGFELSLFSGGFPQALLQKQAIHEVLKYNDVSAKYGLVLTETQAMALVETRAFALQESGRIEFGGGIIDKLIFAFCDSPYITAPHYEETLHDLIETFYYYKNETLDRISDDDLIQYMKQAFDGTCQGSMDLLAGREMEALAQRVRYGHAATYKDATAVPEEEEDDDGEY